MKNKQYLFFTLALVLNGALCIAQQNDSIVRDSAQWKTYVLPSVLLSYGVTSICNYRLHKFNSDFRKTFCGNGLSTRTRVDNYIQYAPGVAVLGLNAAGIRGKSDLKSLSVTCLLSNIFLTTIVTSSKKLTHQQRPDGSAYNSFPSGHTAAAFAGAELLYREYKGRSVWYGIGGYACAAATGYFRMYNNRHTLSDVIAGAGIGVISTKLAYFTSEKLKKVIYKTRDRNKPVLPAIQCDMQELALAHPHN